jgi:hypothetical protein
LVFVGNAQRNWRSQDPAVFNAGYNRHSIGLIAVGCQSTLTRTTAVKLRLDVFFTESQSGRTPVYHRADAFAVGFTKSRYSEQGSQFA